MILLCGIPTETPMQLVRERLDEMGAEYAFFHQRQFGQMDAWFEVSGGRVRGQLRMGAANYELERFRSVYVRLMDDTLLPELRSEPDGSPRRKFCRALHDTLTRWCEVTEARVVNRAEPMGSNFSKPYQAQLIQRAGFLTPETLITSDPNLVRQFLERHGRLIYKSISGTRSIVKTVDEDDLARLEQIRWCPVQFQAFVQGVNVRVHTIGERVFATAIESEATDYRYAKRQTGAHADLRAVELSSELSERCVRLSESLGLAFAGIDLKITPEGDVYCFEVNPCPAYSYYEANTGQEISRALAEYLAAA